MSANKSFDIAQKIISGKIDIEMPLWAIMIIGVVAGLYIAATAIGIETYDKCKNLTEESKKQDNLRQYLTYTLTIAVTIPFTLLFMKLFSKDASAFMFLYSVMGVVGGAIAYNATTKCDGVDESKKNYLITALTVFSATLLMSGFMIYPRAKKKLVY